MSIYSSSYNKIVLNISFNTFRNMSDSVIVFASTINHNLKDSREERKSIVLTDIFACYILSFLLVSQDCFFYHLISIQRTSISHSLRVSLLATNSLSFSSFEKCVDFLFIPVGYFSWIQDSGLSVLFFQHLNNVMLPPLASMVSDKKFTVIRISSVCFSVISIFFFFKFDYNVS